MRTEIFSSNVKKSDLVTNSNINKWMSQGSVEVTRSQFYYFRNQPTSIDMSSQMKAIAGPAILDKVFSSRQYTADMAVTRLELSLKKAEGKTLSPADVATLRDLNEKASLSLKRDSSELEDLRTISSELSDILSLLK